MDDLFTESTPHEEFSLSELNRYIKVSLEDAFPSSCWVRAEMSEVHINGIAGHCYLEFIEKSADGKQTLAKAKGTIWARTFNSLKPYFEKATGQTFHAGLKVLVKVNVEFHEVYGLSLNVIDIDPNYTLGDMLRARLEIIARLKNEGVFDLNKELELTTLPQRLAVITSETAAGYGDFVNQLTNNKRGFPFYIKLFPATMQGEKTESSVIAALERICDFVEFFDAVIIIRGGGATSELNSFDTYNLANNVAQFPLPVITGIGHERDDTIVDMVANTRLKTPTAVAEFLIEKMEEAAEMVEDLQQTVVQFTTETLLRERNSLQALCNRLPAVVLRQLQDNNDLLQKAVAKLPVISSSLLTSRSTILDKMKLRISAAVNALIQEKKREIELKEQFVKMASPEYVLKRGYTLTLSNSKIIKHASEIKSGDRLTTRFADGEVESTVIK